MSPRGRRVAVALVLLAVAVVLVARARRLPEPPTVPPGLEFVVQDDAEFLHRSPARLERTLAQMQAFGVHRARVTAGWSVLAPSADARRAPDFDATDPAAYPQERWASLDRFVAAARRHDIAVMIDVAFWAPRWAAGGPDARRPRRDIDVNRYRDFAEAVARRYRGDFKPPGARRAVPPVRLFTIWNEPNHPGFLLPQWERTATGRHPASPRTYRAMVRAAYPAIKDANPGSKVLIGGTAGRGDNTPRSADVGVPPLDFLRALACVDSRLEPIDTGDCRGFEQLPGDGWAHHPYALRTPPDAVPGPAQSGDVPIGNLRALTGLLGVLADRGRISSADRDLWITEYAYETNPPDRGAPYSPQRVARYLPWSEYLAAGNPHVRSYAQFLWRDLPGRVRPGGSRGDYQSGLYFADGQPKPALAALRGALHAARLPDGDMRLWVRIHPGSGHRDFRVEGRRGGGWRQILRGATGEDGVASNDLGADRLHGASRFRLRYRMSGRWITGPVVLPSG